MYGFIFLKYDVIAGLAGFVHVVKTGINRPVQNLLTGQNWSKPNCYTRAESYILLVYLISCKLYINNKHAE